MIVRLWQKKLKNIELTYRLMDFCIFFIILSVISYWLIRKEANYILGMGLNGALTLSMIILAGIVVFIIWLISIYFIFEYLDPNPYYCEFCANDK